MRKRTISKLLIILLLLASLVGCGQDPIDDGEGQDEDLEELVEEGTGEEKILDMAGREIILPEKIETVFSTGPVGTILLYTLDPEKMVGWNYSLREGEKRYIDEDYHDLPDLGGAGKEIINYEEILKIDPDIIITMGQMDETEISEIEEMQEQLGKSIIFIDDDIEKIDEAYAFLGQVLGQEEKAEELAEYCRDTLDDVEKNKTAIDEDKKVDLYYAEGPEGLQSEPAGSFHGLVIDMVGANNVVELKEEGSIGKSEVSIEQVLEWDPEIIISWDDERGGYYSGILEDPLWADIEAVENGQVYEIQNKPFNWIDRPSSVNRILGLKWLGNLLYPDIYDYDMRAEVKEFYEKFYHYDLTEKEIDELLINSTRVQ